MAKKVKKDFDKDQMYRKIMPSIEPGGATPAPAEPQPAAKPKSKPRPAPPPAADPPSIVEEANPVEAPAPLDRPEPALHNFMEDMMLEKLDRTITVLGGCDCARCKMDVMAIALNALPSAYAVVRGDEARYIKKLKGAYEVKVTAALIKAIQQVKSLPRHHSD